jgi:hypothetical protein
MVQLPDPNLAKPASGAPWREIVPNISTDEEVRSPQIDCENHALRALDKGFGADAGSPDWSRPALWRFLALATE